MRSLDEFEKKIGYKFKNRNLLITALTHSSYANESRGSDQSYERLEFLGDSILGFVTAEYLCKAFPDIPEGKLTKKRAALVCEKSLCGFTRSFGAGELLRLSHGEQHSGGRERPSILADVFESITAAIYLDSGSLEEAKRFVLHYIEPAAQSAGERPFKDHKTMLQEIIQQNPGERLEYVLTGEHGPDHDKHFTVEVHLNSNVIGKGGGTQQEGSRTAGGTRSTGADGLLSTRISQFLFRTTAARSNAASVIRTASRVKIISRSLKKWRRCCKAQQSKWGSACRTPRSHFSAAASRLSTPITVWRF